MATNKIRPASKKTNQKSSCINLDLKHQLLKLSSIFSNMNGHVLSKLQKPKGFFQQKKRLTK
jgi:hypothetical protein